jgi:hypothetical protein
MNPNLRYFNARLATIGAWAAPLAARLTIGTVRMNLRATYDGDFPRSMVGSWTSRAHGALSLAPARTIPRRAQNSPIGRRAARDQPMAEFLGKIA